MLDNGTRRLLWESTNDIPLDSALVDSPLDLEKPLVTPSLVPWVCHQPVLGALFNSPPDDPDGVAAQHWAVGVLVHARLVGGEVRVNCTTNKASLEIQAVENRFSWKIHHCSHWYSSVLFTWEFFIQMRAPCLPLSFHQKEEQQREGGCKIGHYSFEFALT